MLDIHVKYAAIQRSNEVHYSLTEADEIPKIVWVFRVALEMSGELYLVNIPVGGQKLTLHAWLKDFIHDDFNIVTDGLNIPTTLMWRYESSEYKDNSFVFTFVTEENCLTTFLTEPAPRCLRVRQSNLRNFSWGDDGDYYILTNFSSFRNAVRQLERSVAQLEILNVETTATSRAITYRSEAGQEATLVVKRDPDHFQCFQSQWEELTNRRVAISGNIPEGVDLEFVKHAPEKLYFRVVDTDATYFNAASDRNGLLKIEYRNGHFDENDIAQQIDGHYTGTRIVNRDAYDAALKDLQRKWKFLATFGEVENRKLIEPLGNMSATFDDIRILVDGGVVPTDNSVNEPVNFIMKGDGFVAVINRTNVGYSTVSIDRKDMDIEVVVSVE